MNKSDINWVFPRLFPVVALTFFLMIFLSSRIIYVEHVSSSLKSTEFIVNKPYLVVIAEMSDKESLENAVQNSGSKLISKEWRDFNLIQPDRRLRLKEYRLIGDLNFKVSTNDSSLGNLVLNFNQKVNLNKKEFKIETKLNKENKRVLKYNKLITMSPTSDKLFNTVKIKITSELKVKNEIPFFANKIMDKKVKRSNELDLEKTKNFLLDKLNK